MQQVLAAKELAKKQLSGFEGIRGIGIGKTDEGELCIKVSVAQEMSEDEINKIPYMLGKVQVKIQRVGEIKIE
jgi:hypothetical protein